MHLIFSQDLGSFGFGLFGGTIFPTALVNRCQPSGAVSTDCSAFRFTGFFRGVAMSDDPKDMMIPASVRSLLEPYRVLPAEGSQQLSTKLEETFLPKHARLDDHQLAAIGRVATTWSVMEYVIEMTLSRLALAVPFPALALTNDLSIDNRLKALKALLDLHDERYQFRIVEFDLHKALAEMPRMIAKLKDERNRVVHWVWHSAGRDKIFGMRFRATTSSARSRANDPHMTVDQVNHLADKIQITSDALFKLAQLLPEVDEAQHVQFLSQAARRPLPDTE